MIRILQRIYFFFDIPRNQPVFAINNSLFIPGKVVIFFPEVFRKFIPFTIAILANLLCSFDHAFKDRLDSPK